MRRNLEDGYAAIMKANMWQTGQNIATLAKNGRKKMERGSKEHEEYKRKYEKERERRKNNPQEYPWFTYHSYGFHRMDYISDAEKDEEVKFYKGMIEITDDKGHKGWIRYGRQPINIMWAGDRKAKKDVT